MPPQQSVSVDAVMCLLRQRLEGPDRPGACVTVNLSGFERDLRALTGETSMTQQDDEMRTRALMLQDVIETLEIGYHPQNPSPLHPADLLRQRYHDSLLAPTRPERSRQ